MKRGTSGGTRFVASVFGRVALVAAVAASAILPSWASSYTDWTGGSGGTEAAPLEIYNKDNWSSGQLPSTNYRLRFSVDSPTVLTNSAGIATKISDWTQFKSGDFTVLGDFYMSVLGWDQAAGTATVVKKGNWLVTHEFTLGYSAGSYFALTNYSGNMTRSDATSPFELGRANNTTVIVDNFSGDWSVTGPDIYLAKGSGSRAEFRSRSGNFTATPNNKTFYAANGQNSTAIIDKQSGDWDFAGTFNLASGSSSTAEFYHRGGSMTLRNYFNIAPNSSATRAYFEISGGAVTNTSAYIQLGLSGCATMTVKNGGSYTRIGEQDNGSMWVSMNASGSGTLNIEGGEVLLGGRLGFHYWGGDNPGTSALNVTAGGVLTMSALYQKSTTAPVNVLIDDGTFRAYADNTAFLPNASYLTVKVGSGGATFDSAGHDITIASALNDDTGASGTLTFAGNDGTIRLTGALNCTGAINLNERTHLVAKDAAMKSAILSRGITVLKPGSGSAKGTYTLFSVADGTACTDADLANLTLGPGLTGATLSIVNGAITITVTHSTQTWSGPAGASAIWSGPNWDGGELFDDGNDALFATANAIAEIDADANALSLTFNENATLTGTGTLTAPTVDVASGVAATISAPTAGALEKTGAGTLTLGASRTAQTTLSEGTLAMTGGATLNTGALTFGTDSTKPLTLDYGGGTFAVHPVSKIGANCTATFKNGTFGASSGSVNINGGRTLCLGKDAVMTIPGWGEMNNGHLVIDGAVVTNRSTSGYLQVGKGGAASMTIKNGGRFVAEGQHGDGASIWISMDGNGSGTFNVEGGDVLLEGALGFHYYGGSGVSALNVTDGGVLTMSRMYQRSGTSAVNVLIDDGTLRAYEDNTAFIPNQSYITVTIGAGGGTFDANGKKITIAKQLSGAGGVTYKGGGVVTLSSTVAYSGKTTVEVGTCLVVPASIAGTSLAFTIPDGLADGVYEVVTVSGNGSFAADVLSTATLPADANARFRLGPGGKTIYCIYGDVNEQVWIGGTSGSLNVAANWLSGSVPTSGEAIIGNTQVATLTNGAGFTPDTIVFPAESAKVTIAGDIAISSVSSIVNHSTASHEFTCPVSGDTIAMANDSTSCTFTGGITVTAPSFSTTGSGKSDLNGNWRLTTSSWTPAAGYRVNDGSSVTVDGELLNPNNITIRNGGVVTAASMRMTNTTYPAWENQGRLVVTGTITVSNTGADSSLARTDGENSTLIAGGLVYSTGKWAWLNAKTLVLGEDGISFGSGFQPELRFKNNCTLCSRDGVLTLHRGDPRNYTIVQNNTLTIDTTKYGTADVPAIVNVEGPILKNTPDRYTGGVAVKGCGRVVFDSVSTFIGGLVVTNTATVALNAGCQAGEGAMSVADTATLEVAESGTATLGGNLALADGATLAFNFTEKRTTPVLDATGKTVTAAGTVNVKISASDELRPRGGLHTLTCGGAFAGATVALDETSKPKWARGVSVVDGDIVLEVKSFGLMVIVK